VKAAAVDLNADGRPDLRVEFRIDQLHFGDIDIVTDVWGQTRGGMQFSGSVLVRDPVTSARLQQWPLWNES
jgi:hypothetical protein